MPRFETDDRFWEIEREGRRLRFRSGPLGHPGEATSHLTHYEGVAQRMFYDQIARKVAEGFRPVRAAAEPIPTVDPALLAEVLAALAPSRLRGPRGETALAAAWSVLGDWLSARGDIRGEWIALDQALTSASPPSPAQAAALRRARADLLREWPPRWFGELAKLAGPSTLADQGRGAGAAEPAPLDLRWDHGFVAAARIGTAPQRLDLDRFQLGLRDLVPVLDELLDHPALALLRQLRIAELDPLGRRDLGRALARLGSGERPALRRLELGGLSRGQWIRDPSGNPRQRPVLTRIGSLAPLATAPSWAPRLAALRIVGRDLAELPPLPQLRSLELAVASPSPALREWLAHSPWPRIERLWLRTVGLHDPWAHTRDGPDLAELLDQLNRGPLRELGLQGPTALATYLGRAPRARARLRELRLFGLQTTTVDLLLSSHRDLAEVERIVIEGADEGQRWAELSRRFGPRLVRRDGDFANLEDESASRVHDPVFSSWMD